MAEPKGFQYSSPAHMADTALAGMWLFLASECLFFGGLVFVWLVIRHIHPSGVALAVSHTNLAIGTANTAILLTSSLALTVGVQRARAGRNRAVVWACAVTAGLAVLFLGLKGLEWGLELHEGLFPGPGFALSGPDAGGARLFYSLYYVATGVHGIHMLVGLGLLAWVGHQAWRGAFSRAYATPVEAVGLYWSFVDLVWLVLYPLIYLVARP